MNKIVIKQINETETTRFATNFTLFGNDKMCVLDGKKFFNLEYFKIEEINLHWELN